MSASLRSPSARELNRESVISWLIPATKDSHRSVEQVPQQDRELADHSRLEGPAPNPAKLGRALLGVCLLLPPGDGRRGDPWKMNSRLLTTARNVEFYRPAAVRAVREFDDEQSVADGSRELASFR